MGREEDISKWRSQHSLLQCEKKSQTTKGTTALLWPQRSGDNLSSSASKEGKQQQSQGKWAHCGYTMKKHQVAPFLCMPICFYCAGLFLLCLIFLHADLLRTDTLENFRWCCNVLAIENSSLFCLKFSVGAFFSSFTGSITDCYSIYIQCMRWLAGPSGNFRGRTFFFLIVTDLVTVTTLSVSCNIPSDPNFLLFSLLVFILSWWVLYN